MPRNLNLINLILLVFLSYPAKPSASSALVDERVPTLRSMIISKIEKDSKSLWYPTYKLYELKFLQDCTQECDTSNGGNCHHKNNSKDAKNLFSLISITSDNDSDISSNIFSTWTLLNSLSEQSLNDCSNEFPLAAASISKWLKVSALIECRFASKDIIKQITNQNALLFLIETANGMINKPATSNTDLYRILQFSSDMEDFYKLANHLDSTEGNEIESNNIWRLIANSWKFTLHQGWTEEEWKLYAQALRNGENSREALNIWESIVRLFGKLDNKRAYARALSSNGMHEKAVETWKEIYAESKNINDQRHMAHSYYEFKDYNSAASLMKKIWKATSDIKDQAQYALFLTSSERTRKALKVWQSMPSIPERYQLHYQYVLNLLADGEIN